MLVEEAIKQRRSIRKFKDKPVSVEQIKKIIEAGTFAPSGKNSQTWRFTVLTGTEKNSVTNLMDEALQILTQKHGKPIMLSSLNSCKIMEAAPVLVLVWNTREGFTAPNFHDMISKIEQVMPNTKRLLHLAEVQGISAAIQNMLLMAYSMGLGSLWINDIYYVLDELTAYFESSWELLAAVSIGYPEEAEMTKSPPPKLTVDEVTEFK